MKIVSAYSTNEMISEAIAELKEKLDFADMKMVMYFASSTYNPALLSKAMKNTFPGATVFGCSTAGEISTGKMLKNSIVAMAFGAEAVSDVAIGVMTGIRDGSVAQKVPEVFTSFEHHYGSEMRSLDFSKYVGLILVDGLSVAEERIMDRIGDLTDVLFVGGSAGDDLKFACTYVYANGEAYTDAAVLVLLKPAVGFDIVKTQSFRATGKRLVATEVDEAKREVISFNNRPAATVYAEAVGTTVDDAPNYFMKHPLGLLAGDEIYVRSPQQIKDGGIVFYCNIMEGMELALLSSTDMVADTRNALKAKNGKEGAIAGIVNFHCILRTLELEKDNLTDEYGKIFSEVPTVGFSTYGEEYLGHINQTSTILLLR
jgi:hypothetical protein